MQKCAMGELRVANHAMIIKKIVSVSGDNLSYPSKCG